MTEHEQNMIKFNEFIANPSTNIDEVDDFINLVYSTSAMMQYMDDLEPYMITPDAKLLYAIVNHPTTLTNEQLSEAQIKFPETYECWISPINWVSKDSLGI